MEIKLDQIKGVGPNTLKILRQNNIWSTYDLVLNYPKTYEDFTITSIDQAKHNDVVTLKATIASKLKIQRYSKPNYISFKATVFNETISVVVFGRSYLRVQFKIGDEVIIKGKYNLYKESLVASFVTKENKQSPIKPVYKIKGLYDKNITKIIATIFQENKVAIFETIPQEFLDKYKLSNRQIAYQKLHFPLTIQDVFQAKRRFKYEEAFYLQLKLVSKNNLKTPRKPKKYDLNKVKALITLLPYTLSNDQKKTVNDIFRSFKEPFVSYRLIQGDVGSGKTVVTLLAIYAAITAGEQVSFMAPTELLANQHYQYFSKTLKSCNIGLLSGKTKNKDDVKRKIKDHKIDLIIGTHALIEGDVIFANLGLLVIDEQHKFGVSTRDELIKKAHSKDVLYLSATPIPRTLAMIAFGENNLSLIKEKPKLRKPIITHYIQKNEISCLYKAIEKAVLKQQHVFLVVPAISSDKKDDNIETVYKEISAIFSAPIYVLHGRLKSDEKEGVMEDFIATKGSILIATTMIEVGIDIPTATVMGIYGADNFGLSQIHQLRGRIGRSMLQSSCYLISKKEDVERLELLAKINDGFQLSEYDLRSRGPGDFLGVEQSGYLKFNFLDLAIDYKILIEAKNNVTQLLKEANFKTEKRYRHLNKHIKESLKI